MKMMLKMKNRSQRYGINKSRPRHGHKYTKCKMSASTKQYLSNILSANPLFSKKSYPKESISVINIDEITTKNEDLAKVFHIFLVLSVDILPTHKKKGKSDI